MECFYRYKKSDVGIFTNAFQKNEHAADDYQFCSLERGRLVQSIMFADKLDNGANLAAFLKSGRISDVR